MNCGIDVSNPTSKMGRCGNPQRHDDHFRDVFLLRDGLAFFFLGFIRSSPCWRSFI